MKNKYCDHALSSTRGIEDNFNYFLCLFYFYLHLKINIISGGQINTSQLKKQICCDRLRFLVAVLYLFVHLLFQ